MTDKPNIEALSREFCALTGLSCPTCGKSDCPCFLPDFTDVREVLKVMRKREDYDDFLDELWLFIGIGEDSRGIDVSYILDTTGLLLKEAVDFLKEAKADERT